MKSLMPIGRFSKICRLTVKALRHYDEQGLLRPARVDPDSGYRYYSLAQAAEAERIRLLRALEMPLDEIKALLDCHDPEVVRASLGRHQQQIEAQVADGQRALNLLHKLINQEDGLMPYDVRIKEQGAQPIVSVRTHTSLARISETMGQAFGEIFGYLGQLGVQPAGPPLSIYHDPEFKEDDLDIEIGVPCERRLAGKGHLDGRELPGGPVATTLHAGPYDSIGQAYQALYAWIQEHGHETDGPPREVYLVSFGQTQNPDEFRTELAWPLKS